MVDVIRSLARRRLTDIDPVQYYIVDITKRCPVIVDGPYRSQYLGFMVVNAFHHDWGQDCLWLGQQCLDRNIKRAERKCDATPIRRVEDSPVWCSSTLPMSVQKRVKKNCVRPEKLSRVCFEYPDSKRLKRACAKCLALNQADARP